MSGWAATVLAEAVTVAVDHEAGGMAAELRVGSLAGLALALVVPWSRLLHLGRRLGPPPPVRGILALGALAVAIPAAAMPLSSPELMGSAAGAGAFGLLGVLLLALPFGLLLAALARGTWLAGLSGAVIAGLTWPCFGSLAAAFHGAAMAAAVAAVLLLRSSVHLRATAVARLPGTGSPWEGAMTAVGLVLGLQLATWFGHAPFSQPCHAVVVGCVLLGLSAARPGSRPRGTALAAGLLLTHLLGIGSESGRLAATSRDGAWRFPRVLASHGSQAVAYNRATQEVALLDAGVPVDGHGPDRIHGILAALATAGLVPGTAPVLVHDCMQAAALLRASGFGRLQETFGQPSRALLAVNACVDGPVAIPDPGRHAAPQPSFECLRRTLRAMPPGSLGGLVTGFPTVGASHVAAQRFHVEVRRALGAGVLVVPLPLELVPTELLRASIAAARTVHAEVQLLLVRDVLLMVASGSPTAVDQHVAPVGATDRWWWSAGVADAEDLGRARIVLSPSSRTWFTLDALQLAAAGRADAGADARDRILAAMAFLRSIAQPGDVATDARLQLREHGGTPRIAGPAATARLRAEGEASHLLLDEVLQAQLGAAVGVVRAADPADPAGVHAAAVAASSWCHLGAPHAILQAALGLPNAAGTSVHQPAVAARFAHAVDPTLAAAPPAVLRSVFSALNESDAAAPGALEDLARLPDGSRLAALCTGTSPLATALRVRFGAACAAAILSVRSERAWTLAELGALRELASIALVDAAAELLAARGDLVEVLSVWRLDLPVSRGIERLLDGGEEARLALARALPRRKDPRAARALARLMTDAAPPVRAAAGAALERSWPGAVAYDPAWERSRLEEAAREVLALHNPRP